MNKVAQKLKDRIQMFHDNVKENEAKGHKIDGYGRTIEQYNEIIDELERLESDVEFLERRLRDNGISPRGTIISGM